MIGHEAFEHAALSDVGVRRSHNQDSYAILPATDQEQWKQRGHVFVVADGMGAHAVGELASKIAADSIPHIYSKHAAEGPVSALRRAFTEANLTIHTRGQANKEFQGMGTTGTALLLRPEGAWVGHVGDSRAYRIRNGKIEQLTFDHSLLWEVARRQKKDPDQIENVPSNVIIRSLGPEPVVQVDVDGPYPIHPGDVYLLCSDGLSGLVTDREIGAIAQTLPPEEACRFLVHLANLQGGPDNITAVIVRAGGEPDSNGFVDPEEPRRVVSFSMDWQHFIRKAPWPLGLLLTGILLAGFAILLTYYRIPGELPTFLFAALSLIGGLAGLVFQNHLDARQPIATVRPARPQIHRSTECGHTFPLFERLEQARLVLEGRIKEHGWSADWEECQGRVQLALKLLQRGKLGEAFHSECLALLCLMEVVAQHRHREETFKPLWDRALA